MKFKTILLFASVLIWGTLAFADQKVIIVVCKDGKAHTAELEKELKAGWRVITATPVTDSDSVNIVGKPKQAYTATIVFVVEKP